MYAVTTFLRIDGSGVGISHRDAVHKTILQITTLVVDKNPGSTSHLVYVLEQLSVGLAQVLELMMSSRVGDHQRETWSTRRNPSPLGESKGEEERPGRQNSRVGHIPLRTAWNSSTRPRWRVPPFATDEPTHLLLTLI